MRPSDFGGTGLAQCSRQRSERSGLRICAASPSGGVTKSASEIAWSCASRWSNRPALVVTGVVVMAFGLGTVSSESTVGQSSKIADLRSFNTSNCIRLDACDQGRPRAPCRPQLKLRIGSEPQRGHDVVLPYNYLPRSKWDQIFSGAGLQVDLDSLAHSRGCVSTSWQIVNVLFRLKENAWRRCCFNAG
jgi:hypothetical protein